ncbi:MAG: flagellar basal body rod modification protein [Rhodobacter sp.]|jgi:flagellar basal-body rod modification protein FlgD|uniref:flagellar hook capping FlgD N-terminal domain-containing protein n=1 Tax=Tabrizicola sp. TaxID=2005166 RepID=UPI001DB697DD|nr:flagellar hook capping FlgD N-terminal domain-containing protein [Tabrizicola sp.]MBA3912074.1 flagellar basal body rod modification protein [Rhodobacter sp.]MBY0350733.1 flagellar hook assembly protein FlgD [Tabrizicola sp.]MDK2775708.1 flagellar hook assembly protein FlgD [Tabrizicola sp.]
MDISPVTSAASANPGTPAPPKITSDFNTFLRMLTVQMQNQDPMNPIDSADYAVQLATFSGVEQQVRTNQLLADLQGRFQQFGMADMASWIGKEARSDAPVLYQGTPVTLSPTPAVGATRAVLAVRDTAGNLVSREEIPVSAEPYQWLGGGMDGTPLPSGLYSISLESLNGETVIDSRPVEHYARVVEARGGGTNGTSLLLEGGIEVPTARVTALRSRQG